MPPETENCAGSLLVTRDGLCERWKRSIGTWSNESRQYATDGTLYETCGPLRFAFVLSVIENGLSFEQTGLWFLGLRVPRPMRLVVQAEALAQGDGWKVTVRFWFPGLGEICKFEGSLIPV